MKCKICGKEEDPSRFYDSKELEKHQLCFYCNFWRKRLEDDAKFDHHKVAIIDGTHYIIGPEDSKDPFRGFGGDKFVIRFKDGVEVTTTNLWCQGKIDEAWKDKFPNNADFDWEWKKIRENNYLVPKV